MKMTLARALKEKNRIIGKMKDFMPNCRNNVYFVKDVPKINLVKIYNEYIKNMKRLVSLKAAIAKANAENGVCDRMYELEELKSVMNIFNYITTDCTPVRSINPVTGKEDIQMKDCFISFDLKQGEMDRIQERINQLQDEIDEINASVTIDIE